MARVRTIIVLLSAIVTMLASAQAAAPEHVPVAHVSSGSEQDIWGFTYAYNQCTYKALEITGKTITQTQWQVCECDNLSTPCPKNNSICTSNILGDWPGSPDYEVLINDAHTLRVKLWGADQLSPAPDCFSWALATTSYTDTTTPSTPPPTASSDDCPMYEWFTDSDNDGHYAKIGSCESPGAGYTKDKSAFVAYDCDDNDASVTAPEQWCEDKDGDKWHTNCQPVCSQFAKYPLKQSLSKGEDCNDSDAQAQEIKQYVVDQDQDGYIVGFAVDSCGPPSANYTELVTTVLGPDCDDDDASVKGKRMYCHDNDGDTFWSGACQPKCHPTGDYQAVKYAHKKDCDDNDPTKRIVQPFYFDADQDGYPDESSKISECADELNNNMGAWKSYYAWTQEPTQTGTDIIFDECDGDPHGHTLSTYFRDHDGDGIPYKNEDGLTILTEADIPEQLIMPENIPGGPTPAITPHTALPQGVSKTTPTPALRPATARGADIAPHDRVDAPRLDQHSPDAADPLILTYEEREFCSDEAAAEAGFAPAPSNDQWDVCDNTTALTAPRTYCFDNDKDTFGDTHHHASGLYCLNDLPDERFVNEQFCTDCDDTRPEVLESITLFADADNDGFGDALEPTHTDECPADEESMQQYIAGTYTVTDMELEEGGPSTWVANNSDLADYLPTATMAANVTENPGKAFRLYDDATNYDAICMHNGQHLECAALAIFKELDFEKEFTSDSAALPEIQVKDLPSDTVLAPLSFTSIMFLMNPTHRIIQPFSIGTNAYIATYSDPLGPAILAFKGVDYQISGVLTDTRDQLIQSLITKYPSLSPAAATIVQPHITMRLIDFPHPIPVGIHTQLSTTTNPHANEGNADASARRIIAGNCIGPLFSHQHSSFEESLGASTQGMLLGAPWIYIEQDLQTSIDTGMQVCGDMDGDYLPDEYEIAIGTNPSLADSDGDGLDDALEYRYGGYENFIATSPKARITYYKSSSGEEYLGSNYTILPDADDAQFELARSKAIALLLPIRERLINIHKGNEALFDIVDDVNTLENLIYFARSGHMIKPKADNAFMSTLEKSYITDGHFLAGAPALFGLSAGCGKNFKDICIMMHAHKLYYGGAAPLHTLVNTFLHEMLHHAIVMKVPDPKTVLEHKIIDDVLGRGIGGYSLD